MTETSSQPAPSSPAGSGEGLRAAAARVNEFLDATADMDNLDAEFRQDLRILAARAPQPAPTPGVGDDRPSNLTVHEVGQQVAAAYRSGLADGARNTLHQITRPEQPAPTPGVGDEGLRERVEALAAKWDDECANGNGVRSGCLPRNGKPNHSHDCGMTREAAAAELRAALDPPDTDQGTP